MNSEFLIELNYHSDLHNYYQKLCELPGFVLLESKDQTQGRYDILSAFPYEHFTVSYDEQNLNSILSDLRSTLPHKVSTHPFPFQGGLIGYISYDFGARLMGIKSVPQTALSTMPLLNLGLYDWAIISDHYLKSTYLYAANNHPSSKDTVNYVIALWNSTIESQKQFSLINEFRPMMSKEHYEFSFKEIKSALRKGRSYQVNFTQPFEAQYQGDSWAMYHQTSNQNPVPFSAFLRLEEADILSFSPERFLFYDNGRLITSPIKGTIRRSDNSYEDELLKQELFASEKNRAENVMIVDLLRNDLGKIAQTGSVNVLNLCEVQSYNSVHHLVSNIEAQSKGDVDSLTLFLSCFPGGSITGAPKLESMRIIDELELCSRGIYCGSIVYFSNHGRFDSNIAIRTITAKNNTLHLAAGGGIVIDSNCEEEYLECYLKIKAIINGLK